MDPRKFDEMIKKLSRSLSRRSIVGGSVGASLLTAAGLSEDALAAKNKKNRNDGNKKNRGAKKDDKGKDNDKKGSGGSGGNDNVKKENDKKGGDGGGSAGAEACIPTGKRCPAPKPRGRTGKKGKNRKPKKLGCDKCCQGITVTVTNNKGNRVTKCSCKPLDSVCTPDKSNECCSGVCGDGRCRSVPCADIGSTCADSFDCCSGFCSGGVCQSFS